MNANETNRNLDNKADSRSRYIREAVYFFIISFCFAKNESERIYDGLLSACHNQIYRKNITLPPPNETHSTLVPIIVPLLRQQLGENNKKTLRISVWGPTIKV